MIGLNVSQLGRINLMFAAWVSQRIGRKPIIGDVGTIRTLDPEQYMLLKVVVNFSVCRFYGMLLSEQKVQNRKPFKMASSSLLPDCPRTAVSELPLVLFH